MTFIFVTKIARKGFGSPESLKYVGSNGECLGEERFLQSLRSPTPYLTVFTTQSGRKWIDEARRATPELDRFALNAITPQGAGIELTWTLTSMFINIYLGEDAWAKVEPDLERGLQSEHLWLQACIDLPVDGGNDSVGQTFSFDGFRGGQPAYLYGLPKLELVQRHIP
jgi:hypothetical protein